MTKPNKGFKSSLEGITSYTLDINYYLLLVAMILGVTTESEEGIINNVVLYALKIVSILNIPILGAYLLMKLSEVSLKDIESLLATLISPTPINMNQSEVDSYFSKKFLKDVILACIVPMGSVAYTEQNPVVMQLLNYLKIFFSEKPQTDLSDTQVNLNHRSVVSSNWTSSNLLAENRLFHSMFYKSLKDRKVHDPVKLNERDNLFVLIPFKGQEEVLGISKLQK